MLRVWSFMEKVTSMRRTKRIFQLLFATALLTGLVGYLVHGSVLQAPASGTSR